MLRKLWNRKKNTPLYRTNNMVTEGGTEMGYYDKFTHDNIRDVSDAFQALSHMKTRVINHYLCPVQDKRMQKAEKACLYAFTTYNGHLDYAAIELAKAHNLIVDQFVMEGNELVAARAYIKSAPYLFVYFG